MKLCNSKYSTSEKKLSLSAFNRWKMNRLILLLILIVLQPLSSFSQDASWSIVFDGKTNVEYYRKYDITSENNQLAIDFSRLSHNRNPINFKLSELEAPKSTFSIFVWVKAPKDLNQSAIILSNKKTSNSDGWEIRANNSGAWNWNFSQNGKITSEYNATSKRQAINDGEFHLIGLVYDYTKNQAWFYFDGKNVGIINIGKGDLSGFNNLYLGGVENGEKYSFNGYFKSIHLFKDQIHNGRVVQLFRNSNVYNGGNGVNGAFYKSIKFLTWNISDGGNAYGEKIGLDRTLYVIKESKADIIALQETNGSGEYLADELGYYYYSISKKLSILSKFPIKRTVKLYKAEKSGGVEIAVSKKQYLYFFNISLDNSADWSNFNNKYYNKSFVQQEQKVRGIDLKEMMEQIRVLIKPKDNTSIVFSGEFNSISNIDNDGAIKNYPVSGLLKEYNFIDSYRNLNPSGRVYPGYTRNTESKNKRQGRVDYIYYKGNKLQVSDSEVLKHHPIKFPSSNFGVLTEFIWKR